MKLTVLLATPLYPPESGGPATFAASFERLMPVHSVAVRTVKFSAVRALPWGIRHLAYARLLVREGRKSEEADVLLVLDPLSTGFPAWVASVLLRIPLAVRVVGDYAWEQGMQRAGVVDLLDVFLKKKYWSPLVFVLRIVQAFVAKRADTVVVPSKYLGTVVGKWGVSKKRVSLIYNGFLREAPGNLSVREKLNIRNKLVISVGRLVPWKGFRALIDIAPELYVGGMSSTVLIVGDGPDKQEIDKKIKQVKQVMLEPGVSHRTILGFIKEADVFVLNTGYEGFSHVLLEAMSIGTPVVTTDVGGNPELIRDKEEGLLVPYNNKLLLTEAIKSLLSESTMRTRLIETARRTASTFTEERMAREYAVLLTSLIKGKNTTSS